VADVGDVHDVGHVVAVEAQHPREQVLEQERPQVADVGVVVHGRPAGVEPDAARPQRLEASFARDSVL
jgi:hypothetical protein